MHILMLRADQHAQYEIRIFAEDIINIMEKWCPIAHEAFTDYRLNSAHLSGPGLEAVKRLIAGENVTQEDSGLNKREWDELSAKLDLNKSKENQAA
jgi:thymidylate synthase (FAD)